MKVRTQCNVPFESSRHSTNRLHRRDMPNLLRSFTGKIIPGRRKRPSPLQVNDTNVSHPTTTDPKLECGPHLVSVSPCDPGGAGNYLSTNHPTFDATLRYTSGPSQGLEDNLVCGVSLFLMLGIHGPPSLLDSRTHDDGACQKAVTRGTATKAEYHFYCSSSL